MFSAEVQNRLDALLDLFRGSAERAQPAHGGWELEVKGDLIFVFIDAKQVPRGTGRPYLITLSGRDLRRTERLVFQIRSNGGILTRDRDEVWIEVTSLKNEGVEDAITATIRDWLADL